MKARSREVNILNMSLLDILSGALGAFCFLTLILLPSYSNRAAAAGGDTAALQKELDRTRAKLQQALDEMAKISKGQPFDAQEMLARLKQAEEERSQAMAAAQQAQALAQQARQQAQQAQQQAQQVQQSLEKARGGLEMAKEPLMVQAFWESSPGAEVDLYVRWTGKSEKGEFAPKFDPNAAPRPFFAGQNEVRSQVMDTWLIRDVPAGEYEVYYRVAKRANPRQPVRVTGYYFAGDNHAPLPQVTLDANTKGLEVGTIVKTAEGKLEFHQSGGKK